MWQHFCELKTKPCKGLKAQNGVAILCFGITRYVDGWGRIGDMGFVALVGEKAIASAWLRLGSEEDAGFGYIASDIPELAMAVLPEYRGKLKELSHSAETHCLMYHLD